MIFPKRKNLWAERSSESLVDTPWLDVRGCEVTNPNGGVQAYTYVSFKNKAVGVVPYEDGYVWMVGQSRFPLDAYSWELPEGGCPIGEDTLEAARRELSEETGLTAQNYAPILQMHTSNSCTDEWAIVYLATGLTQGQAHPEACEDITVQRFKLDDIYAGIETGEITDAMTVAATYKLMLLKSQGKL